MASLPFDKITEAAYNRLTADLSDPVIYAGSEVPGKKYVAVDIGPSTARRTFTSRGRETTLICRCHVHGPKGTVPPLHVQQLADAVDTALQRDPLDLGADHGFLDLAPPNTSPNRYQMDNQTQAHDLILRHDLKTQDLTTT